MTSRSCGGGGYSLIKVRQLRSFARSPRLRQNELWDAPTFPVYPAAAAKRRRWPELAERVRLGLPRRDTTDATVRSPELAMQSRDTRAACLEQVDRRPRSADCVSDCRESNTNGRTDEWPEKGCDRIEALLRRHRIDSCSLKLVTRAHSTITN